jgi:primosomal protein N' (replication factor Y)
VLASVYPLVSSRAVARPFTYEVPDGVGKGAVVAIRFGRAAARGVVVETGVEAPAGVTPAAIESVLYELPPALVKLALWVADYYGSTPARALELVAPKLRARRGERRVTAAGMVGEAEPAELTEPQQRGVARIAEALAAGGGHLLLAGATGSGKTEVYLQACAAALAQGRGAIVLVPEIALTPQTVGWFRARFERIAVLHSRMTDAQRLDMWLAVERGEARVVVGARSAVFAPVGNLGVIVVDEEHEPSFKQASTPRYHAREVAVERARAAGAVCVLGSATPALESWLRAKRGAWRHLCLRQRVSGRPPPPVEVVDMRNEPGGRGTRLFSARLELLLRECLARGEQAILFQNRRGFAPVLWCSGCEEKLRCEQCSVGLTWHRRIGRMVCHMCCEERVVPAACPSCTKPGLHRLGAGSERVEEELRLLLPAARVRRMDSDTMRRREDYEQTLSAFGRGEVDVLVGTQMIAKGLDFPRVTLVGIVAADGALHLPDFRAPERTFQLISQVAGRAGRGELAGRIVVQTTAPEHPAITHAARHDYRGFAERALDERRNMGYPPFGRLIRALVEDERAPDVEATCERLARAVRGISGLHLLGPATCPIALARGRHRRHLMVKTDDPEAFAAAREALIEAAGATRRPRVTLDVDPVSAL